MTLLQSLPIDVVMDSPDLGLVLGAGRQHGLSAYDAAYLTLAAREGLHLATHDKKLARAAQDAGVPLLVGHAL